MTSVQLKDLKGKAIGEVVLDDELFGIEPNTHVMHAALHRQLANGRSGSAATLTRSEVRGGGRKPWRQKGTGRARVGSIRSPLWNGGGVIFGPQPRDYYQSMPKKARQLAVRSAIAARKDEFVVVKTFHGMQPKTKEMAQVLKDLGLADKCVLLVLDCSCPEAGNLERAARNLANVKVLGLSNLNVKDLIEAEAVLMSEGTLELINQRFKGHAKAACGKRPSPQKSTCADAGSEPGCIGKGKKAPAKAACSDEKSKTAKTKSEPEAKKSKTQKKVEE